MVTVAADNPVPDFSPEGANMGRMLVKHVNRDIKEGRELLQYFGHTDRKSLSFTEITEACEGEGYKLLRVENPEDNSVHCGGLVDDRIGARKVVFLYAPGMEHLYPLAWAYADMQHVAVLLKRNKDNPTKFDPFYVNSQCGKAAIASYLRDDVYTGDCVVCSEETIKMEYVMRETCSHCGAFLCLGCVVDLVKGSDIKPDYLCPNCRQVVSQMKTGASFAGFLAKNSGHKLLSAEQCAFMKVFTQEYNRGFLAAVKRYSVKDKGPMREMWKHFLQAAKTQMDTGIIPVKPKSPTSAKPKPKGFHCANCQKSFWDKSAWKRAPKCTKCQRTAYCNGKCRKKHAKAHATECAVSVGKKRKPKPKSKRKAKKKRGCVPY